MVAKIKLIVHIRRANLDTFQTKEPGKVVQTRRDEIKIEKLGSMLGLSKLLPVTGPFPLENIM